MSGERSSPLPPGLTQEKLSFIQIAKLIESTKWAVSLSGKEVETLSKYLQVWIAEKDTVIVREGSKDGYLCLLVEGKVNVMKAGDGQAPRQLGSVGPGHTFGEMSMIDGQPRSASVVAEEKTTLVLLTAEGLNDVSLEVPRLGFKVLLKITKSLSQRLRQTSGALVDLLGD